MSLTGATTVSNRSPMVAALPVAVSGASSLIRFEIASVTSRVDGSPPIGSPVTRMAAVLSPYDWRIAW